MDPISAVTPPKGYNDLERFQAERSERAFKSFEAMFVQMLLKEMRKTIPENEFFPKSPATENYEEMLDGTLAQAMADSGQLGIAKQLEAEAKRLEEGMALLAERSRQRQGLEPLKAGPKSADTRNSLGTGE
jgi:Rod binding domain-containing protein